MENKNKNMTVITIVLAFFLIATVVVGIVMAAGGKSAQNTQSQTASQSEISSLQPSEYPQSDGQQSRGENTSGEESAISEPNSQSSVSSEAKPTSALEATTPAEVPTVSTNGDYSAVWISYLEYQGMNMSAREGFVRDITAMFANCVNMGANTVIVHVRPFGDALYNSAIFPQSHLLTGTQGQSAGYDPLGEMVEIAHSMNLKIEAWVNPYRVRLNEKNPANIAANNPANNSSLVMNVNGGIYYNPALTAVQDIVVEGVAEIVANYNVDGIHIDDYFYPTTDLEIDKTQYQNSGTAMSQEDWRRENVNSLVRKLYAKVKSIRPNVVFGISPQGNNDNNYNTQYSDVKLWLSTAGYADYIMPQLYWGFGYLTKSGRDDYQFIKLANQWASYPRASGVKLYLGLGAYRIGEGDGGSNDQREWHSGYNLMQMVNASRSINGVSGCGFYRYDSLFKSKHTELAESELEHLKIVYDR